MSVNPLIVSTNSNHNTHLSQVLHPLVNLFWFNRVLSPGLQIQTTCNISIVKIRKPSHEVTPITLADKTQQ